MRGLRAYRPGDDDIRAIHWPSTARLGQPIVREREREASSAVWVILERGEVGAAFERGIEWAAALVHEAYRRGVPFTLVVPPDAPLGPATCSLAHRRACLEALARLRGHVAAAARRDGGAGAASGRQGAPTAKAAPFPAARQPGPAANEVYGPAAAGATADASAPPGVPALSADDRLRESAVLSAGPQQAWPMSPGATAVAVHSQTFEEWLRYVRAAVPRASDLVTCDSSTTQHRDA